MKSIKQKICSQSLIVSFNLIIGFINIYIACIKIIFSREIIISNKNII